MTLFGVDLRDLVAGFAAIALLLLAGGIATRLQLHRRRQRRALDAERALGRTIIAELPTADDLVLFSEDSSCFYYGDRSVAKDSIVAGRVLINGTSIAAVVSNRHAREATLGPTSFVDRPGGIARDRWDVAIETVAGTTLVQCGAIRERVSQELAQAVFEAVKRDVEWRNERR